VRGHYLDTRKENDEALEIGAKIGYIYSGRKKA